MATSNVSMLLFITLFTSHVTNTGWALRIDIEPSKFTEEHSGYANVTCSLDNQDTDVMTIVVMEIIKDGGRPLVYLQPSGITYGASLSNTAKADGVIDADVSKSFLTLSLLEPRDTDGGVYTCKIFFLDNHGQVTEHRASSNLTIENINVHEVVKQLAKQVLTVEKQLAIQTATVTELKEMNQNQSQEMARIADEASEMKEMNRNQSQEMAQMADEVINVYSALKSTMTKVTTLENELTNKGTELENTRIQLQDTVSQLNDTRQELSKWKQSNTQIFSDLATTDTSLQVKVKTLEDQALNQSLQMMDITDKVMYTVAFSADLTGGRQVVPVGANIVFDNVLINEGGAYDKKTGIFTVPRNGLYAFHMPLMTYGGGVSAYVHITADNVILASMYIRDTDSSDQSSVSCVRKLERGSKVTAVVFSSQAILYGDYVWSSFTGYLIKAF